MIEFLVGNFFVTFLVYNNLFLVVVPNMDHPAHPSISPLKKLGATFLETVIYV